MSRPSKAARPNERFRRHIASIGFGLAIGALVVAALLLSRMVPSQNLRLAEPREVAYEGTRLDGAAPAFQLTDQNGNSVSLSDFEGTTVVLTLLDPYCTDICPIYANQYRLAYHALGQDSTKVAFLAFNANDEKTAVAEVAAATRKWGMDEIANWHFLTGSPEALHAVWKAYGVLASGPPKPHAPGEMQHSPAIFVIDQAGQQRWYLSTNFEGAAPASALIVKHVRELFMN